MARPTGHPCPESPAQSLLGELPAALFLVVVIVLAVESCWINEDEDDDEQEGCSPFPNPALRGICTCAEPQVAAD